MRASNFDDVIKLQSLGVERVAEELEVGNQSGVNLASDGNVHRSGESVVR